MAKKAVTAGLDYEYAAFGRRKYNELPPAKARRPSGYRAPDERDVVGVIARGYYRHTDTKVRVYDEEGALLGTASLEPGDNVEVAAKKLLKEKCGGAGFYGRINYPRNSLH